MSGSVTSFTTFGDLLKHLRRRARLTQRELSIAVGYSEAQINRLEKNLRKPDPTIIAARFVEALQLENEPETVARLLELTALARGEARPEHVSLTQSLLQEVTREIVETNSRLLHNLPHSLTSFIGREQETAAICNLMLTHSRLVTLTGAGGVGKTRLALETARTLAKSKMQYGGRGGTLHPRSSLDPPHFKDGVWLVELAAITDPTLVPQTVAGVLRLPDPAGFSCRERLLTHLQPKHLLLILDNCEHLVVPCADLVEQLLRACPQLSILATSREALNIAGEIEWPVPSLTTPGSTSMPIAAELRGYEAVRLFVERARAAKLDFALTDQNAPAIAHICAQLEGIPLAIELAAARLKGMTAEQIAARLADQFNLLTSNRRTALPRQQTLRAAIDWSYDLLTEAERALLQRLSVFTGGWTLEAAEQIDNSTVQQARVKQDSTAASANPLDLLMQLVNKSLVLVNVHGAETRYRMLEIIRAYALEKLTAQGELEAVCRQHALVYLALIEAAEPHLHGRQQADWLDRLEHEQNNFRAALTWCRGANGDVSLGLRLVAGLWQFWWFGHAHEGCRWLEDMLQVAPPDTPPKVRAQVLLGAGMLAVIRNEDLVKAAYFEEAAHLFQSLNDPAGLAVALQGAAVAKSRQDYPSAIALVEESLALCRQLGYTWGANQALLTLGIVAKEQADYGRATAIFTEVLGHFRQADDGQGMGSVLNELASVAVRQLDFVRSCACAEESLQTARLFGARAEELNALMRLGDALRYVHDFARASTVLEEYHRLAMAQDEQWHVITALMLLGKVAKDQGDHRRAIEFFAQSIAVIRHLSLFESLLCDNLEGMACVASAQGQFTRAARLFGAAETLHEMTNTPLFPQKRFEYAPSIAALQGRLGKVAFAEVWAEGQSMTAEAAIRFALE